MSLSGLSKSGCWRSINGVSGKALASYAGDTFGAISQSCRELLGHSQLCPILRSAPHAYDTRSGLEVYFATAELASKRSPPMQHSETNAPATSVFGINAIAPEHAAAPAITSFVLPSPDFPRICLDAGF